MAEGGDRGAFFGSVLALAHEAASMDGFDGEPMADDGNAIEVEGAIQGEVAEGEDAVLDEVVMEEGEAVSAAEPEGERRNVTEAEEVIQSEILIEGGCNAVTESYGANLEAMQTVMWPPEESVLYGKAGMAILC